MKEIYTIGYAGFQIQDFIKTLRFYGINSLIDVRSNPHSKIHTDYNRDALTVLLKKNGIIYRNYNKEFGARQNDIRYYPDGYLNFSLFCKSPAFQSGMSRIINAMPQGYKFVLMCSEKDPLTCHRNIMVAKEFYDNGISIKNILSSGDIISQERIEQQLVDLYYPNRDQLSFFDEPLSWNEMVQNGYKFQNQKIGYCITEDGDD